MSKKGNPFGDVFNSRYISAKEDLAETEDKPQFGHSFSAYEQESVLVSKRDVAIGKIVDNAVESGE